MSLISSNRVSQAQKTDRYVVDEVTGEIIITFICLFDYMNTYVYPCSCVDEYSKNSEGTLAGKWNVILETNCSSSQVKFCMAESKTETSHEKKKMVGK